MSRGENGKTRKNKKEQSSKDRHVDKETGKKREEREKKAKAGSNAFSEDETSIKAILPPLKSDMIAAHMNGDRHKEKKECRDCARHDNISSERVQRLREK